MGFFLGGGASSSEEIIIRRLWLTCMTWGLSSRVWLLGLGDDGTELYQCVVTVDDSDSAWDWVGSGNEMDGGAAWEAEASLATWMASTRAISTATAACWKVSAAFSRLFPSISLAVRRVTLDLRDKEAAVYDVEASRCAVSCASAASGVFKAFSAIWCGWGTCGWHDASMKNALVDFLLNII